MQPVLALHSMEVRVVCPRHPLEVSRVSCFAIDLMNLASRHVLSQQDHFLSKAELIPSHKTQSVGIHAQESSPKVKKRRVCFLGCSKDTRLSSKILKCTKNWSEKSKICSTK